MEAKKATKTVGQHNKTPLGWSKSGRVVSKTSVPMDSTGNSFSSGGGGGSESSSRLEDSALLISPPNQVIVLMVTPPCALL